MDEKTSIKLLSRHGIKPTSNRILVVKALAAEDYPSTLTELESHLISVDKSGIFRALTLFREHHRRWQRRNKVRTVQEPKQ